jgi:hypothetical protein
MNKPISKIIVIYLPYLLLGLASFSFFYFLFDYIFFYQEKEGLFLTSSEYFFKHFNRPGGLLMYLSEFLTAFYYFPFAGAIILSTLIVVAALLVQQILKYCSGENAFLLPFLAGGILFYLHSDYHFLLFNSLGIVLQLASFYLVLRSDRFLNGWLPVILFPFWYFATGSLAFIFALQFSLYLILKKERQAGIQVAIFWLFVLLFVFFSNEFFFYFGLKDLLSYPFNTSAIDWRLRIYFALAAVLILLPLMKINLLQKKYFSGFRVRLALPILFISASVLLVIKQMNPKDKSYFHVEKLFYQDKFDEIIDYNLKNPSTNILTGYLNNLALSERGKLTEMLFQFPQSADAKTLFLPWDMAGEVLKRGGYFYYSIGMINEAHRWAYENMVMNGNSPEGLKMLIKTELISGNLAMAGKYIDMLGKSLFYRKDAAKFQKLAVDSGAFDQNPELVAKRRLKLKDDFFVLADKPLINLEAVIKSNPENRIALEYELAFLLLKKDFNGLVNVLSFYRSTFDQYLPLHVEEAVVAYKTLGIGDAAVIETLNIRPETIDRFTSYLQTLKQFGNNKAAAQQALYKSFGDTFWYYIFYK